MTPRYQTSAPDAWVSPRSHRDASQRYYAHGPIEPMDDPRRGTIRTTALSAAALFAFGLLLWSFST